MPELVLIQIFSNKYKTKRLKRHCITLTHICNYKLKNNSKTKWGVTHHLKQNCCGVCEKVFVYLCFLSLSLQSAQVKLLLPSGKSRLRLRLKLYWKGMLVPSSIVLHTWWLLACAADLSGKKKQMCPLVSVSHISLQANKHFQLTAFKKVTYYADRYIFQTLSGLVKRFPRGSVICLWTVY